MFDQLITFQARLRPAAPAVVTTDGEVIDFARLDTDIDRMAGALLGLPALPPDEPVAVALHNPYLHWLALLALARLSLPSAAAQDTRCRLVLTDDEKRRHEPGCVHVSAALLHGAPLPAAVLRGRRLPGEAIGRVLHTSGTTERPKRIPLTWKSIEARHLRNAFFAVGTPHPGRWLILTGTHTVLGFMFPLACWGNGNTLLLGSERPLSEMLVRFQPNLIALVPSQLQALLSQMPADFRPSSPVRLVTAGSVVSPGLVREAQRRLTPDIMSIYGASECGTAAIAGTPVLLDRPNAGGYALPDVAIEVVDEGGAAVLPGSPGEIRIRSDRVVSCYLDDPEQSAISFREGWFYPGDIGRIDQDGLLLVEGRVDDVINLGGVRVLSGLLEQTVMKYSGVADAAAFGVPDKLGVESCWIAIVCAPGFERQRFEGHLRNEVHGLAGVGWIQVAAVPRNAMGKIQRDQLRQLFASQIQDGQLQDRQLQDGQLQDRQLQDGQIQDRQTPS